MAALALTPLAQAEQDWQWQYRKWMPPVWQRLARCETGLNWRHNSGTYQGGFGLYYGTYDAYRLPGYPREAYQASPWQQWQVAKRVAAHHSMYAWGCYRGANHAWVRGDT